MMYPYQFLGGVLTMGYFVLGVFFQKFWRRTRDPLFRMFAWAFWLMAINGFAVTTSDGYELDVVWSYLLRLLAFVLIIVAIIRKNMEAKTPS
jgi:hypothetical protein